MYNGHADVTALLKPDGTIAATYYYDAFGNITDTTGAASNTITFAGYQYDKETGLYYLNARMYDPKTARFLQEDTYTGDRNDPLSLNLYVYCHNEPLMYSDPTGHSWISDRWDDVKKWGKKAGNALADGAEWFADKASDAWDTTKKAINDNIIKPVVKIGKDIKSAYSAYKKMSPKEKKMLRAVNNKVLSATDPVAAGFDSLMSSWEDFNQEMDQNQKFLNSNRIYTSDPIGNNIGAGIYKSLSKTITNTYDVLTNPFEMYDTAKLLATMSNPNMTQQKLMYQTSIGINAYNKFNEFNDADAFTKIYMGSEAATDVAQIAAPFVPKGLKALRGFEVEEAVSLTEGTGTSRLMTGDATRFMTNEVDEVSALYGGVNKRSFSPNRIGNSVSENIFARPDYELPPNSKIFPSESAARRAAFRNSGIGKHGGSDYIPETFSEGSGHPFKGTQQERPVWKSKDTGFSVAHDMYGHKDFNVPPHYNMYDLEGNSYHYFYPSSYDWTLNR
jgi:RHS repeat-associated protein